MRPNEAVLIQRCTAQLPSGEFCDARSLVDVPFPICGHHARQLQRHLAPEVEPINTEAASIVRDLFKKQMDPPETEHRERMRRRAQQMAEQSVVYYVRIHDHVKIGFTNNVKHRLGALRVDEEMLLATEPGGRELEAQRHAQFADERVGRRENFNPSRRLLAHIDEIVKTHGPPVITSWRNGID